MSRSVLNPFCKAVYDDVRWDLSSCYQSTVLVIVPSLLLLVLGGIALPGLLKRWKAGERPEKGGKAAYKLKLATASFLILAQAAFILCAGLASKHLGRDERFLSGFLLLATLIFVLALHYISHPTVAHSSTPLLWYELVEILVLLINLRSAISIGISHSSLGRAMFALLVLKLVGFVALFSVECLGPDGWDDMTWRDLFTWLPFVKDQGKIKLRDNEETQGVSSAGEYEQQACPRLRANIFSRLTFSWLSPMVKLGKQKYLTEEDLWALPDGDTAEVLAQKLENAWTKRRQRVEIKEQESDGKKQKQPSLTGALVEAYGGPFIVAALFKLLQDSLAFIQPQLLKRLLQFVGTYKTDDPEPAFHGYIIALSMFACAIVQTILLHCYFSRVFETGMRVRGGLISLIYKKSLLLSNDERGGRLTGDIVNLQSTDATRLQDLCTYGQIAWSGVFQITLAFISLYNLLGWTMLVGVAVMVGSMPITAAIARIQTKLQRQQMKNKDKRTSIMSEILNNIRSIKLYAWEDSFAQRLFDVRNNQELVMLRKIGYLSSTSNFFWSFTPFLVAFSSFAMFSTISGRPLTSEVVFPAITLFQLLSFPLAVLPMVFSSLVEAYVSVGRLTDFLCGKELQKDAIKIEEPRNELQVGDELISVMNGEFCWNSSSGTPTLEGINLSVKKGELIAVVGRVGSGKSSIISAILGEMTKNEGDVKIRGSVAYCSQQAYIMGGTVRSNITFGYRFNQEFYDIVVEACALKEDLAILPQGDATEVGEKGISLSGGQKARISLARAVYSRADIYLLDDPLAAVDAHVGRHLFDRVIGPNGLLSGKARLLTTNAIPYCEQADELIFLRNGIILERNTYAKAIQGDSELSRLLIDFGKSDHSSDGDEGSQHEGEGETEGDDSNGSGSETTAVAPAALAEKLEKDHLTDEQIRTAHAELMKRPAAVPLDQQKRETLRALKASTRPKEHRSQGSVKWTIYKNYLAANGYVGVAFYLITIIGQQLLQIATNVWLKNWSQRNAETGDNGNIAYYLTIYAALGCGASIVFLINGILLYSFLVIRAARKMHDSMYHSVIRSPMLFFETTPLGTILNRFSRDVDVVDSILARVLGGFVRTLTSVGGMVGVIAGSAPIFLVIFIPLTFVYRRIQIYYLATNRELKRLDATTKSPIFASFQETLGGVATIRAYRQSRRFIVENEARIDRNQEAYFPSINANRWLAVRLEFLGSLIILSTAVIAVFTLVRNRSIDAGIVGLMLSYGLSTTQTLNWIVRSATEVETNIVSVERMQEYIDLASEAPLDIPDAEPVESWPATGDVSYEHVAARYRENLDLVLKDVCFDIKGGEKVGVCGRTGAGKSSLTMVLYRVIEVENGRVMIDNVDVSKIGLRTLRSRLSIIPQDSQCFEGTMRDNMDPTGKSSDADMWKALEQCRLKSHVESMDGKLDARVDEGGSNLSAGQRQLLCLGRALLRRSKILVLDEATAAVDNDSDREIQLVIRQEFKDCTILVIAHRLNTILDCDKIIVMDQGKVAEFASPSELLAKKDSIFYSLATEAGLTRTSKSGSGTPRSGARTPARKD